MKLVFRRSALCLVASLALASFAPLAAAEAASAWEPPPEGAVEMFAKMDRLFAVGAASGGAGVGLDPDGGQDLPPSPGGSVFDDSRCAMQSGTCGGTCVSHLNYYCSTSACSDFKFC